MKLNATKRLIETPIPLANRRLLVRRTRSSANPAYNTANSGAFSAHAIIGAKASVSARANVKAIGIESTSRPVAHRERCSGNVDIWRTARNAARDNIAIIRLST